MNSIDKLREWADGRYGMGISPFEVKRAHGIADEIEREIAANYYELPKDADGIPIRLCDRLEGWKHPIDEISFAATGIALDNCEGEHVTLHMLETDLRHYHAPTVEDVLCEMIHEYGCTDALTETIAAKYAERVREVMRDE